MMKLFVLGTILFCEGTLGQVGRAARDRRFEKARRRLDNDELRDETRPENGKKFQANLSFSADRRRLDDPWTNEATKLTAGDGAKDDWFGYSVAISGTHVVVGACLDDDLGTTSGSAYVFEFDDSGLWSQTAKLLPDDGAAYDYFGFSVAISGTRIVVGAYEDDDLGSESGSAYVFEFDDSEMWSQAAKLLPSDGAAGDQFGRSVAISGTRVVIGAWGNDDSGTDSGSAYVFELDDSETWSQTAKLLPSDGAAEDQFGRSVAISGTRVVVGASNHDDLGDRSGSAYVFELDDDSETWSQTAKLLPSDGAEDDQFGYSVAISGTRVVVGAIYDDDLGDYSGSAYVFEFDADSGTWSQTAKLLASDGAAEDYFGRSVAISGTRVVVGAYADDDLGTASGSAYVFELDVDSDTWSQTAKLLPSDGAEDDWFGYAVAVDDDTVVIGAYNDDDSGTSSGSCYVFDLPGLPTPPPLRSTLTPPLTTRPPTPGPTLTHSEDPACPVLALASADQCPDSPDSLGTCVDEALDVGDLCEADGDCGTTNANNCGDFGVYRVVAKPFTLGPTTTLLPTPRPTDVPTLEPSREPTTPRPTVVPTLQPSLEPTTPRPTDAQTLEPSREPTTAAPVSTTVGGGGGGGSGGSSDSTPAIAGGVVGGVIVLLIIGFCLWRRRAEPKKPSKPSKPEPVPQLDPEALPPPSGEEKAKRSGSAAALLANARAAAKVLLTAGSQVPGIGPVCYAAIAVLDECAAMEAKAVDVAAAGKRVCNTIKLLQILSENAAKLDNDNAKTLVEQHMVELERLLRDFEQAVASFRDKGWLRRKWYSLAHTAKLTELDALIVECLDQLGQAYRLANDRRVEKLLESQKYALEEAMRDQIRMLAAQYRLTDEVAATRLANDATATAAVAVEGKVAHDELRIELNEHFEKLDSKLSGINSELLGIKQGLSSELSGIKNELGRKSSMDEARKRKSDLLKNLEVKLESMDERPCAEGGQAQVHKGKLDGAVVAVKRVPLKGLSEVRRAKLVSELTREVGIMVALSVRGTIVTQVRGIVTTDPNFYSIVLEWMVGGSLRDRLDDTVGYPDVGVSQIFAWCHHIARGMEYVYARGVEHRDLKSSNVLLDANNTCKISDFGLARSSEFRTHGSSRTTKNKEKKDASGTLPFMAPELLQRNVFTEKSDVYSYAVTCFEIVTREHPWAGLGQDQIWGLVVYEKQRPSLPAGAPAELVKMIENCWTHAPADRPTFAAVVGEYFCCKLSTTRVVVPPVFSHEAREESKREVLVGQHVSGVVTNHDVELATDNVVRDSL